MFPRVIRVDSGPIAVKKCVLNGHHFRKMIIVLGTCIRAVDHELERA